MSGHPCVVCGQQVPEGARFCTGCGTPAVATARRRRTIRGLGPLTLAGGVLALAGSFLPWLSAAGDRSTAWDISVAGLVVGRDLLTALVVGVLVAVVVVLSLPLVTRRPLPPGAGLTLGTAVAVVAVIAAIRALTSDPGPAIGAGLALAAFGGLLIAGEDAVTMPRPVVGPPPGACPTCGTTNPGSNFCRRCGRALAPPKPPRPSPAALVAGTIVPGVLVVAALGGAGLGAVRAVRVDATPAPRVTAAPHATDAPDAGVREVRDARTGVAMEVPRPWVEARRETLLSVFDPASSPDGTLEAAQIGVEVSLDDAPDGDIGQAVVSRLEGTPGYKRIDSGPSVFGGRQGFRHEFDLTISGDVYRFVEFFVPHPTQSDKVIRVAGYARGDRLAEAEPVLNRVFASTTVG